VRIKLISKNSHDPICFSGKPHGLEKKNYTGYREEFQDISTDNDAVETGVMEFDIFRKLIYK